MISRKPLDCFVRTLLVLVWWWEIRMYWLNALKVPVYCRTGLLLECIQGTSTIVANVSAKITGDRIVTLARYILEILMQIRNTYFVLSLIIFPVCFYVLVVVCGVV
jgi:hypothetical protein